MSGPAADVTPTFEIPPGYVPGPEMDNFTQVETDEKYSFLVPRVTYGGCSMLNKVIYDPHHTHIGLVRPGSAPAGTRPPTHIHTHLIGHGINVRFVQKGLQQYVAGVFSAM